MESQTINKDILIKLAKIETCLNYLKEHIDDITLTREDLESIEQAEEDLKNKRVKSHEKLKKELE